VSALLAASTSAFLAFKLAGAAYLVYLGARMLFSRASAATIPAGFSSSGFLAIYRQGLLTNVLNPKVALFFLAFMPQFIAADSPSKFAAFITLGLCFITTGTLWCYASRGFRRSSATASEEAPLLRRFSTGPRGRSSSSWVSVSRPRNENA
jgi:threonine/homoserine/homoserine lactone efflux protein